jgi:hypothetical protein
MMSHERWGAFSVMDHNDPGGVAPDVLLFDRLAFPVPATQVQKDRWEREGWHPERQAELLGALGDLAYSTGWNEQDQLNWADLHARLQREAVEIVKEAKQNLSYQATRMVLAQKRYPVPEGVEGIDVVGADRCELGFRQRFKVDLEEVPDITSNFALRLRQRVAVPFSDGNPMDALTRAIQLAQDADFRRKRTTVFELQNRVLSTAEPILESVQKLDHETEELISYICMMVKPVKFTNAFAIVGVHPGYAVGQRFRGYTSPSTTLSGLRFRSSAPGFTPQLGSSAPAAMYRE